MNDVLIYGATCYTGRLVAERAVQRGFAPVLAGRRGDVLRPIAERLRLRHCVFSLEDHEGIVNGLAGMTAVLHAAGPFSATARPMVEACLAAGVHYLDITGEIAVFETIAALDSRAKAAAVMLMPGVGFDVVPSDCLAAHVAARLPDATELVLSIGGLTRASRGTAKTMVEGIALGTQVRRNGSLVALSGTPRSVADFGGGLSPTVAVSWGDVSTAWFSTGIPNIEVFFEADPNMRRVAALPSFVKAALGTGPMQRLLKRQIDKHLPPGPTADQLARGRAVIVAEARNARGDAVVSRLTTPEPYALTAQTAVEIMRRVVAGEFAAGFQTPSAVLGADFITGFEGVSRTDV